MAEFTAGLAACYFIANTSDFNGAIMGDFTRRSLVSAVAAAALCCGSAAAQHASPTPGPRVALKGYDPVAYFTDGKPAKGSSEFTFAFDDTTYWFKSAEHRDKFASDPEHYAPQFDGYCAVLLSRGHKVAADPEVWTITNGKLYVFSSKGGKPIFQKQPVEIAQKAGENWPKLRSQ